MATAGAARQRLDHHQRRFERELVALDRVDHVGHRPCLDRVDLAVLVLRLGAGRERRVVDMDRLVLHTLRHRPQQRERAAAVDFDAVERDAGFLPRFALERLLERLAVRHHAAHQVVPAAGVDLLVRGATGHDDVAVVRVRVEMHGGRRDAERAAGAALDRRQHRAAAARRARDSSSSRQPVSNCASRSACAACARRRVRPSTSRPKSTITSSRSFSRKPSVPARKCATIGSAIPTRSPAMRSGTSSGGSGGCARACRRAAIWSRRSPFGTSRLPAAGAGTGSRRGCSARPSAA